MHIFDIEYFKGLVLQHTKKGLKTQKRVFNTQQNEINTQKWDSGL